MHRHRRRRGRACATSARATCVVSGGADGLACCCPTQRPPAGAPGCRRRCPATRPVPATRSVAALAAGLARPARRGRLMVQDAVTWSAAAVLQPVAGEIDPDDVARLAPQVLDGGADDPRPARRGARGRRRRAGVGSARSTSSSSSTPRRWSRPPSRPACRSCCRSARTPCATTARWRRSRWRRARIAERATVPCVLHLDHAVSEPLVDEAVALGFTSVMYDGSRLGDDANRDRDPRGRAALPRRGGQRRGRARRDRRQGRRARPRRTHRPGRGRAVRGGLRRRRARGRRRVLARDDQPDGASSTWS